jgi:hypothetical protein
MLDTTKCPYEVELVINREVLSAHIKRECTYMAHFAHKLGMCPAHLYKFMNTGIGGGRIVWAKLYYYCKANNLNFDDFLEG